MRDQMDRRLTISSSSILLFLGLFPFLRLLPIDARVQPVVIFISILVLALNRKNWNIPLIENRIVLTLICFLTIYAFISLNKFGLKNVIIEYISLIAGPVLFLCLTSIRNLKILNTTVFKTTVIIYIIFGLVEVSPLKTKIFPLLNNIIPLYKPYEVSSIFGFRGLSYAAPEPSNAAFIIITLLYLYQIFKKKNYDISKFWELILISMAILNKSGTMLLFLGFYFTSFYILQNKNLRRLWIILVPLSFVISLTWIKISIENDFNDNRMLQIADRLTELSLSGEILESNNWYLISGPRFAEVGTGYSVLTRKFFGYGIGSIEQNFSEIIRLIGMDFGNYWNDQLDNGFFDSSKPNSYLSFLACSTGIVGVLMILYFLFKIYKRISNFKFQNIKEVGLNLFWISCFMILFRTTATIPIPWILLALIFQIQKFSFDESSSSLS